MVFSKGIHAYSELWQILAVQHKCPRIYSTQLESSSRTFPKKTLHLMKVKTFSRFSMFSRNLCASSHLVNANGCDDRVEDRSLTRGWGRKHVLVSKWEKIAGQDVFKRDETWNAECPHLNLQCKVTDYEWRFSIKVLEACQSLVVFSSAQSSKKNLQVLLLAQR